jgi:hypothetical protein
MDYKSKYLKYKTKYLQLLSQNGGTKEDKKSNIINGYVNLDNKGTQNCGVYYNYKDPEKILLCNGTKLTSKQLEFLNLNNFDNLKVYPRFYQLYHSFDTDEYFYLWEKMDGDLRDFFLKHIPTRILKKHKPDVTQEQIKLFTDFINYKSAKPQKLYVIKSEDFDINKHSLLGEHSGFNLVYRKKDEYVEVIKYKLNLIKSYNNLINDISYITIITDIISEIEKQLNDIIIILTKKRYILYKNNFYSDDKKFDNIVYKIIENDGDNYRYEFYFIDPESTLKEFHRFTSPEKELTNIIKDLSNRFEMFKMIDVLPNIYDIFLTSMFNIYDTEDNHKNLFDNLFFDYLKKEKSRTEFEKGEVIISQDKYISLDGWDFCMGKYRIDIKKIFPIKINTERELLKFIGY